MLPYVERVSSCWRPSNMTLEILTMTTETATMTFLDAAELTFSELLALTADDLETLESFDEGMSQMISLCDHDAECLAIWWQERERRIKLGQELARREAAAWLLETDTTPELVPAEGQQVITLPSFFWGFACDYREFAEAPIRSVGADDIEVAVSPDDLEILQGIVEAVWEDVEAGNMIDTFLEGAAWYAELDRQLAWMGKARRALNY